MRGQYVKKQSIFIQTDEKFAEHAYVHNCRHVPCIFVTFLACDLSDDCFRSFLGRLLLQRLQALISRLRVLVLAHRRTLDCHLRLLCRILHGASDRLLRRHRVDNAHRLHDAARAHDGDRLLCIRVLSYLDMCALL